MVQKHIVKLKSREKILSYGWIIENLILHRWQYFKNNPNGSFLFIRAILCVLSALVWGSIISILVYMILKLIFNDLDISCLKGIINFSKIVNSLDLKEVFIAVTSSISLSYWNMSNLFGKKWTYCSQLYNQITIKDEKKDRLRNALAIDLLTVDLWAHRSFSSFFYCEIEKGIKGMSDNDQSLYMCKLHSGNLLESKALEILGDQHEKLFEEEEEKKKKETQK